MDELPIAITLIALILVRLKLLDVKQKKEMLEILTFIIERINNYLT